MNAEEKGMRMSTWFYRRQWVHQRLRKWLIHPLYSRLYRDTNRDTGKSIIVAGTGRSGTTWVAKIIGSQLPCRVMFEPFHSRYVGDFRRFNYFQYMRPEAMNSELRAYCRRVFTGNVRHAWIDREVDVIFPRFRVIKEIRANLFLKWSSRQFPEVPLLFVMRHPCAVVLSRMKLAWATDGDIEPFLSQPQLIDDFLADKMDLIETAKTPEQKHAIVWCISNLVPLRQFGSGELNLVFYEHLCMQPEVEIPRLFEAIGQEYDNSVFAALDRPSSAATQSSAVMHGHDKVARWKKELSPGQVDDILSTVEAFGLDDVYGTSLTPILKKNFSLSQKDVIA